MADWITSFIAGGGYWAIMLLMALENVFPPIPSELIMPFAGAAAGRGDLDFALVVAAGTIGSLAGTLPWYWVGYRLGSRRLKRWTDRHGRWITISTGDVERAEHWFKRNGHWAVAGGRLVPALRTVISAPAGVTGMRFVDFLLWSAAGTVVWSAALAAIGLVLDSRHDQVAQWLNPVTTAILVTVLLTWIWRVVRFSPDDHRG
jgi:membrane protein DedA with SNARE-associated domain